MKVFVDVFWTCADGGCHIGTGGGAAAAERRRLRSSREREREREKRQRGVTRRRGNKKKLGQVRQVTAPAVLSRGGVYGGTGFEGGRGGEVLSAK